MFNLWSGQVQFMTILTFIWPLWPWPSTYLKKCFKWHFSSSRTTTVQNYFWNPCINVQVIVWTSLIYDHFGLYLTPRPWPSTNLKNVSNGTSPPPGQQLCKIILKSMQVMLRTSSMHVFYHFDLYLTPVTLTFNLLKKCFKWHFSSSKATTAPNCFEIHALLYKLWSGQIPTDARNRMHGHTPN